jgi:hypothetical protein
MARRKFMSTKMATWKPLSTAMSQKEFDDRYIALLAKEARLSATSYRGLLLHLAQTCDSRRYVRARPDNLGRVGHPPKVPPAVEARHAALLAEGVKPSRADSMAAQGDKKLADALRKRRTKKPKP